jgi:hypothetical protein
MSIVVVNSVWCSSGCCDCEGGYESTPEIKTFESIEAFLRDPNTLMALKNSGFVNEIEQKEIKSRLKTDGKVFVCKLKDIYPYGASLREIKDGEDLKITSGEAEAFAKGDATVLLGVSPESILDKKALSEIEKAKKSIKSRMAASKKAAETKKAKARAKEVEKARKILEDAGEALPLTVIERLNRK